MNITVTVTTQFTVTIDNVPGTLAEVAKAHALAGVNFEGFFQTINGKECVVHFVTPNVDTARTVLASLGRPFSEKRIIALQYADKPGVIAHVAQAFGDANINIEQVYLSTPGVAETTVLYIGVAEADLAHAVEVAEKL